SASKIATPPPMISGRSCLPRMPVSNRNEIPACAATSRKTIGAEASDLPEGLSSAHTKVPQTQSAVSDPPATPVASRPILDRKTTILLIVDLVSFRKELLVPD